jgi:carbamoyl-phosphate synthase large subunit
MEHIEEAGVHSGDSACSLPPYSLSKDTIEELCRQTTMLALSLNVIGLMNVQFAVKDKEIYLIEVNPRASRTVPFVAKAVGSPIAAIAAQIMAGSKLSDFELVDPAIKTFAVKEAVLPFARFPGVDTILGPEMRSTGEVMGTDLSFHRAFMKAQIGAGNDLPKSNAGKIFISIKDLDKTDAMLSAILILVKLGYSIIGTRGTSEWFMRNGVELETVNKVYEGRPNIVDQMKDKQISLVFNTTETIQAVEDSRDIRKIALYGGIPYFTTAAASIAAALAMEAREQGDFSVNSIQR